VLASEAGETAGELYDPRLAETIDPATWRLVRLQMRNSSREDDLIDVTMLRPLAWLQAADCRVGQVLPVAFPEMGLRGESRVLAVEACPEIAEGPGYVVLGTVTRLNSELVELAIEGEPEPLGVTATHPLYSETAQAWVPVGQLSVGDMLRTREGPRRIESVRRLSGAHRVYNLSTQSRNVRFSAR